MNKHLLQNIDDILKNRRREEKKWQDISGHFVIYKYYRLINN